MKNFFSILLVTSFSFSIFAQEDATALAIVELRSTGERF